MAETSGFFNTGADGQPTYDDTDQAAVNALLHGQSAGVVCDSQGELAVTAGTGLQVTMASGAAWLGVPCGWWYFNDATKTLTLDAEANGYKRMDWVILRLDRNTDARAVHVVIKKGNPTANNPSPPSLTQTIMVYELPLARVLVTGGSTAIQVTDERRMIHAGWQSEYVIHEVTATNGNTYSAYQLGTTISAISDTNRVQSEQGDNTDFPTNGTLVTHKLGTSRLFQTINRHEGNDWWKRTFYVDHWTPWRRQDSGDRCYTSNHTLVIADKQCFVRCNRSSAMTVTIPKNVFPVNTDITIYQQGAGQVTIAKASGVTVAPSGTLKTREQGECVVLRQYASNVWAVMGADKS